MRVFQRQRILDEDAALGTTAHPDHDGGGSGKAHRTGATHHQYGNRMIERKAEVAFTNHHPNGEDRNRNRDDCGDENRADAVGYTLDGRLGAGRAIYQLDDLGKRSVLAHLLRFHCEVPARTYRCTGNGITGTLICRDALACNRGLVDTRLPFADHTIDGNRLTCTHFQHIPWHQLGDVYLLEAPIVAETMGGLGSKIHQTRHRVGRAPLCTGLEVLAQGDERQDHSRTFEVQVHHGLMGKLDISSTQGHSHPVQSGNTVDRARCRAQGDKRVHGRGPMH